MNAPEPSFRRFACLSMLMCPPVRIARDRSRAYGAKTQPPLGVRSISPRRPNGLPLVLGVGLAGTVLSQGEKDGPTGPLWFDVLALVAIVTPLFARRRFPFGAPLTVGIAVVLTSFVDERLVPLVFIPFLAGCAAPFLVGLLRERTQAVASSCLPSGSRRLSPTGIPWEHSAPHPDGHRLRHRLDDRIRARPQVPGSGRGERAGCPGRAGAGGTGTLRGERGARADRARIARFRRPQRQRHDGAGLRGAQAASARAGARARGSPCRRAEGTRGAGGDAADGRCPQAPRRGASARAPADPRALGQAGRAGSTQPASCLHVTLCYAISRRG